MREAKRENIRCGLRPMSDKAASQKTRSPEGCDENGPAAALLLSHVSIQICSFVAPCRRPILIATPLNQSRTRCTSGDTSSADEFLDTALTWFGDPDPRIGTAWEKGERLAKLVAHRRTLLVLDGLEPLQNPPGPQEGRLREPSLQALLRELAAFNTGLCVI